MLFRRHAPTGFGIELREAVEVVLRRNEEVRGELGLILWVLDTEGISGPVNASAPNPVTNKTFSKLLGKVLKRPAFFPAPKFAVTARSWNPRSGTSWAASPTPRGASPSG